MQGEFSGGAVESSMVSAAMIMGGSWRNTAHKGQAVISAGGMNAKRQGRSALSPRSNGRNVDVSHSSQADLSPATPKVAAWRSSIGNGRSVQTVLRKASPRTLSPHQNVSARSLHDSRIQISAHPVNQQVTPVPSTKILSSGELHPAEGRSQRSARQSSRRQSPTYELRREARPGRAAPVSNHGHVARAGGRSPAQTILVGSARTQSGSRGQSRRGGLGRAGQEEGSTDIVI